MNNTEIECLNMTCQQLVARAPVGTNDGEGRLGSGYFGDDIGVAQWLEDASSKWEFTGREGSFPNS